MEAVALLQKAAGDIDQGLKEVLDRRSHTTSARMYHMLEYFLGFRDTELHETAATGGKRFRPMLCLAIADGYGARERAAPAALSIEMFHNFTLIHDDIADHDETRRNRPTLWKLFGVDHALNAGDAQSLFAYELALRTGERALTDVLIQAYYEVIEGQFLDFETSRTVGSLEMTEELSLEITRKKTGALVRVSAETAGIAAGRVEDELILLRTYGENLGVAFQLADDYRSVWATQQETGKDTHSDIRERKKTLPYVYALTDLSQDKKTRLQALYTQEGQLSEADVHEAKSILDATKAQKKMKATIDAYAKKAKDAARFLTLPEDLRSTLVSVVDELSG